MVLKTFNVEETVYKQFAELCKNKGMSMSKQVEFFMRSIVEKEPEAREEYIKKLENIRTGKFIKVNNFSERYGL